MKLQKKRPVPLPTPPVAFDDAPQEPNKAGMAGLASSAASTFKSGMRIVTGIFKRTDSTVSTDKHSTTPKLPLPDLGPRFPPVIVSDNTDATCSTAKPASSMPVVPNTTGKVTCSPSSNELISDSTTPVARAAPVLPEIVISSPLMVPFTPAVLSSTFTPAPTTSHQRAPSRADSAFSEYASLLDGALSLTGNDAPSTESSKSTFHRVLRKLKSRFSFNSQRSNASSDSDKNATAITEYQRTSLNRDVSQGRDTTQGPDDVQVQVVSCIEDEAKTVPVFQDTRAEQDVFDIENVPDVKDEQDIQDMLDLLVLPWARGILEITDGVDIEGLFEADDATDAKFAPDGADATNTNDEDHDDAPSNSGSATSEDDVSSSDDNRDKYDKDEDDDDNNEGPSDVKHGTHGNNVNRDEDTAHRDEDNIHPDESSVEPENDEEGDDDDEEEEPSTDESGRAEWDKMNAIPLDSFTKLLECKLPTHRKMLASCITGTTRGAYHYVVFLNCLNSDYELEQFVIKVPAHGVPGNWRGEDGYMLCQEAETMKYLFEFTTIPVPEVIAYSPDASSRWGFPYIIMSRLPGQSAAHIWCDDGFDFRKPNRSHDVPSPQTEKKRINFLRSLAREMSKLKDVPFRGIGMPALGNLESDTESSVSDTLPVDSTFIWTCGDDPESVEERAACFSTQHYTGAAIEKYIAENDVKHQYSIRAYSKGSEPDEYLCQYYGVRKLLDMVFAHPVFQSSDEDFFYLQHDDLDLQNVLTDDEGNVTGIIDWDGSLAMPRCVAHAALPNFLRRDWFPDQDGTAAHLYFRVEHYRQVYAAALVEAGNPDALYTTKSGLYQAAFASIFAGTGGDKYEFIEKLLYRVPLVARNALDFTTALGDPALCSHMEEIIKPELHKILEPELPHINLQELVWDVAARVFTAEFDALLAPPPFEELAQAWMAGFTEFFELEQEEPEDESSDEQKDESDVESEGD